MRSSFYEDKFEVIVNYPCLYTPFKYVAGDTVPTLNQYLCTSELILYVHSQFDMFCSVCVVIVDV